MNRILKTLVLALVFGAARLAAQDFAVIVNEAVPLTSVTTEDLSRLFQKRATRWANGLSAEPVDQTEQAGVRERFSQAVFAKSVDQVKTWWQTQIFSGRGVPPVELSGDQAVIGFVQSHAGAVGYVSAAATLPAGVKRLRVTGR